LGHAAGAVAPPAPPTIGDSIARMVQRDADLAEVFAKNAKEQKIQLARGTAGEVAAQLVEFLRAHPIKRVALSVSPLLDRLGVFDALKQAGFDVSRWDEITLDGMYDFDCAVTDVQCAVAENATLVIRPSASQGRSMSLTPMFHVAVVEQKQIIPDMIDLFEQLGRESDRSNVILITGPSKTADIEMNVVTGVHGPNVVKVFLLP
jgi:L-lactate dehydrogenase complex protein LldG